MVLFLWVSYGVLFLKKNLSIQCNVFAYRVTVNRASCDVKEEDHVNSIDSQKQTWDDGNRDHLLSETCSISLARQPAEPPVKITLLWTKTLSCAAYAVWHTYCWAWGQNDMFPYYTAADSPSLFCWFPQKKQWIQVISPLSLSAILSCWCFWVLHDSRCTGGDPSADQSWRGFGLSGKTEMFNQSSEVPPKPDKKNAIDTHGQKYTHRHTLRATHNTVGLLCMCVCHGGGCLSWLTAVRAALVAASGYFAKRAYYLQP